MPVKYAGDIYVWIIISATEQRVLCHIRVFLGNESVVTIRYKYNVYLKKKKPYEMKYSKKKKQF